MPNEKYSLDLTGCGFSYQDNFANSKVIYWETEGSKRMKSFRNMFGTLDIHVRVDKIGREIPPYYRSNFYG